ncbi:hypothetical protein EV2_036339 [Malus domestica]
MRGDWWTKKVLPLGSSQRAQEAQKNRGGLTRKGTLPWQRGRGQMGVREAAKLQAAQKNIRDGQRRERLAGKHSNTKEKLQRARQQEN